MDVDPVDALRRWEDTGALWQVLARGETSVTVGLFRCDGGEEVGRLTSADPRLAAYVAGRGSNADDARPAEGQQDAQAHRDSGTAAP